MTRRAQAVAGWVLGAIAFAVITSQLGCSTDVSGAGKGPAMFAEALCEPYGYTCGKVYEFDETPADNELGVLELCVRKKDLDAAQARYGRAQPSTHERFDEGNLCVWCCPTAEHSCPPRGANAFDGPFCPGGAP